MKNKFKKIFLAFSVIELLISLIAISCMTAAFAPTITKKIKTNGIAMNGKKILIGNQCPENCPVCYVDKCLYCAKICSEGYTLDSDSCTCISCSTGCKQCNVNACTKCETGYLLTNGECKGCEATYSWDSTNKTCSKCEGNSFCPGYDKYIQPCTSDGVCLNGEFLYCNPGYMISSPEWNYYSETLGTYVTYSDKSCSKCRNGEYCPGDNENWVMQCPTGTVCESGLITGCSEGYGWKGSSSFCDQCTGSQYSNGGTMACTNCPTGTTCSGGVKTGCIEGYGWDSSTKTCTKCTGSQYSNGGTMACSNCPTGTTCSNGVKTGCYSFYGWNGSSCTRCSGATYSSGGTMSCTDCPAGSNCAGGGVLYCDAGWVYNNTTQICDQCTGNTYASGQSCKSCPDGTICENGIKVACNPNYAWNSSNRTCSYCGDAYWNNGGNDENCYSRCPEHGVCDGSGNLTSCEDGYYNTGAECIPCNIENGVCKNGELYRCYHGTPNANKTACWDVEHTVYSDWNITTLNVGDDAPIPVYAYDYDSINNAQGHQTVLVDNIEEAVKVCLHDSTCDYLSNSNKKQCWAGETAAPVWPVIRSTNGTGHSNQFQLENYSSNTYYNISNRLVCNLAAADFLCEWNGMQKISKSFWQNNIGTDKNNYDDVNACLPGPTVKSWNLPGCVSEGEAEIDAGYSVWNWYWDDSYDCRNGNSWGDHCQPGNIWVWDNNTGYTFKPYVQVSCHDEGEPWEECISYLNAKYLVSPYYWAASVRCMWR